MRAGDLAAASGGSKAARGYRQPMGPPPLSGVPSPESRPRMNKPESLTTPRRAGAILYRSASRPPAVRPVATRRACGEPRHFPHPADRGLEPGAADPAAGRVRLRPDADARAPLGACRAAGRAEGRDGHRVMAAGAGRLLRRAPAACGAGGASGSAARPRSGERSSRSSRARRPARRRCSSCATRFCRRLERQPRRRHRPPSCSRSSAIVAPGIGQMLMFFGTLFFMLLGRSQIRRMLVASVRAARCQAAGAEDPERGRAQPHQLSLDHRGDQLLRRHRRRHHRLRDRAARSDRLGGARLHPQLHSVYRRADDGGGDVPGRAGGLPDAHARADRAACSTSRWARSKATSSRRASWATG